MLSKMGVLRLRFKGRAYRRIGENTVRYDLPLYQPVGYLSDTHLLTSLLNLMGSILMWRTKLLSRANYQRDESEES